MINIENKIELPSNKSFGYSFTLIFFLISLFLFYFNKNIFAFFVLSISLIILLITFIKSDILYFPNLIWFKFGLLLGKIVSPLILGLIYFFIFTPVSIFSKMFGRDELSLKVKKKNTYWKSITMSNTNENFKDQF